MMTYEETLDCISGKIDIIKRNKTKIARHIISEGWLSGVDPTDKRLADFLNSLYIKYFDFDPEEKTVTLIVKDKTGLLQDNLSLCIYDDNSIDIDGWSV